MNIKKIKVCFLAPADSIHSYRWIKYFADNGYDIHWVSLVPNQFKTTKDVKFYLLKSLSLNSVRSKFLNGVKFLNVILNIESIKKLIKEINPDILHSHGAGVNGIIAALAGFHPFILTAWGSDILMAPKSIMVKSFVKFVLKKADLITCDAQHMKEAMVKLGADESKIKIINFGIDIKKFYPGSKDKKLERELEISNFKVVISVRRLEKLCDIETLIKATPLVLKKFPKVKFVIIGSGSLEKYLKKIAKDLKVAENIKFVGAVANEELPKYLRLADIFVSTSLSDAGIASSTAEAMACGLPVVITDFGENRKWIKDGENGFIISIKSPLILAEKIIYLLKNEKIRKKFGRINKEIIKERNNYYKEMDAMGKIYCGLLNGNRKI